MGKDYPLGISAKELGALRALLDSMDVDYHNDHDELARSMLLDGYQKLKGFHLYFRKKEILFPYLKKCPLSFDIESIRRKDSLVLEHTYSLCERAEKEDVFSLEEDFSDLFNELCSFVAKEVAHFLKPLDNALNHEDDQEIEKEYERLGYFLLCKVPDWE